MATTRTTPTTLFAAALAALLSTAPTADARPARPTAARIDTARAGGSPAEQAARYQQWVAAHTDAAVQRIATSLRAQALPPELFQAVMRDVHYGAELLRQRAAAYGLDQAITTWEMGQVIALASSIQSELTKTYGNLDPWKLLV